MDVEQHQPFTIGELARRSGLPVQPDTPALRLSTADRFAQGGDPRVERYWELMGVVNGWHPFPSMTPAFLWTIEALRAHPRRGHD